MTDNTCPAASPRSSVRWLRLRMRDPSDVQAYDRFRHRLHAYTRHSSVSVVTSTDRIGVCHRDPAIGLIDELLLIEWLRRQPDLHVAGSEERWVQDAGHQPLARQSSWRPL